MSEEQKEEKEVVETKAVVAPVKSAKKKSTPKKSAKKAALKKSAPAKKPVKKSPAKKRKVTKKAAPKGKKQGKSSVFHKALLKPKAPPRLVMNFKVEPKEANQFRSIAKKYTRGNLTALIRLAVPAFRPKKTDLVSIRPSTRK